QEISYNKLAWDFVNAVIKTSTDCEGMSVQDLLMDCATADEKILCNNKISCNYCRDEITKILVNSLGARNDDYNFSVKYSGNDIDFPPINSSNIASCRNSNYATVPFSTGSGTLEVAIRICVK
ncbi:MAG: hypothetical protein NTZ02_04080, partial [Candidatus Woesearchaeota archaeon]|nr:hypothetical protein [Candidatus Woesearchaeota archaeon]